MRCLSGGCEEEGPNIFGLFLTVISVFLLATTLPFSLVTVVKVVQVRRGEGSLRSEILHCTSPLQEYERAVIFRLGRLLTGGARGPGVFFIIPCLDAYQKIDMRTSTYDVPPQEILTKDSVTVFVNAIMYYKVKDATLAVANVDDYAGSAKLLAATTLRNILGTRNLGDILSERESIAREMKVFLQQS